MLEKIPTINLQQYLTLSVQDAKWELMVLQFTTVKMVVFHGTHQGSIPLNEWNVRKRVSNNHRVKHQGEINSQTITDQDTR